MIREAQKSVIRQDAEPAFVEFDAVAKSYDGKTLAARDISFGVRRGEFFTMLGPSGSGKTSCLMMLAGFEQPTSGDIRLDGRSLAAVAPYDRNIGVVFQNYALFPHLSVAENIAFPLSVRRMSKADMQRKVDWVLGLVRLEGLADRRPGRLSGGQQQRVALARALVFNPDLVLMDEPLGALDRQLREHLQVEIRRIQQEIGATVVFVTHDQGEALSMSDRIAVFDKGTLQQVSTPEGIYCSPANAFVAGFVGESNRLSGKVLTAAGEHCQVEIDGVGVVSARRGDAPEAGERAMISVRPEHLRLQPDSGEAAENTISLTVDQISFQGDHARVDLRHDGGGALFFTRVPVAARHHIPSRGQKVSVSWLSENCLAYREGR